MDGDRKYSEKSCRYYRKIGLNAVVKNIPEYKQPRVVYNLLEIYNPDILVITGHDSMIKEELVMMIYIIIEIPDIYKHSKRSKKI